MDDAQITARWDFGDGGTSDELSPEYTFEVPGEYSIEACFDIETDTCDGLTICPEVSATFLVCGDIDPSFEVSSDGSIWSFTNTTIIESSGCMHDYAWEILDPSGEPVPGFYDWNFESSFSESGAYEVTLWVEGLTGAFSASQIIEVEVEDEVEDEVSGSGCGCATGGGGALGLFALPFLLIARRRRSLRSDTTR